MTVRFSGAYLFQLPVGTKQNESLKKQTIQYLKDHFDVELETERFASANKYLVKTPTVLDVQPHALEDVLLAVANLISPKAKDEVRAAFAETSRGDKLKQTNFTG